MSTVLPASFQPQWETLRFGQLVARSKESNRPDLQPLSVYLDDGVVPRSSREDNHNRLGADMSNYLVVRDGDIVFNKLRTWQGGLGVSRHEGVVSPAYFVCRPRRGIDSRYYHYLLRSRVYLAELTRLSKFMPPSQFDISWDDLRTLAVPLPSVEEQRAIADYLDTETTHIDALITKKRRVIELLDERIDSEILQIIESSPLVGANQFATEPIRRLLRKHEDWTNEPGNMVTAFRDGEVTTRAARGRDGFTDSWTDQARTQRVQAGDIVVHGLDGFSGAIGDARLPGICSPVYHVCSPFNPDEDGAFYGRLLRLLALDGYLGNFAVSTRERAVDFRNWDLFGRIPIPAVPADTQRRIGDRIRAIRPLQNLIGQTETLAAEKRQALITAAVTGELRVPGAAA